MSQLYSPSPVNMLPERSDHVSVGISDNFNDLKKSKSLWRVWNQLSRFQRSLIYMLFAVSLFTILYFIPSNSDTVLIKYVEPTTKPVNKLIGVSEKKIPENTPNQVLEEPNIVSQHNVTIQFSGPTTERQHAVVEAFKHAWRGYKKFAWGHDNLKPLTQSYHEWFGLGLTILDSLDTMYIMGLKEEYEEARNWIEENLNFEQDRDVNLFEVTIRVLGGLLSIFHLSGDQMYLEKAVNLGDRLLPCFETASGIPFSDVNLRTRKSHPPKWSPDSSTAEVTTIQLEFRDLSRCTGDPKYEDAVAKVSDHIHSLQKTDGLVPIFINPHSGQFRSYSTITLGARGDSYYEYLLKQWLQTGKTIEYLHDDYITAIEGIHKHLLRRTVPKGYAFLGELLQVAGKDFKPKMDHLTCFLPGTLALGVHHGLPSHHMKLAEDLLNTCYQTYAQQPTFLAPEITYFNINDENSNDLYVKTNDAHNLLRPEFIESLWYMYQLNGNVTYQEWGWRIFQAFEKYTKVKHGYTSIGNVKATANVKPKDMMESFFLGETLKYFYLLFSDDRKIIDLDKFVINSEAHPLPIYNS